MVREGGKTATVWYVYKCALGALLTSLRVLVSRQSMRHGLLNAPMYRIVSSAAYFREHPVV